MINNGIDIVHIPRFADTFKKQEWYFKKKVFTEGEFRRFMDRNRDITHLAGIFAAKEAAMKAFEKGGGERWLDIEIDRKESGAPYIARCTFAPTEYSSSLSISHDGDYAVASVVFFTR